MDAWHERERKREMRKRRSTVSLMPETTEREGVGLAVVEATELAHRFLQPLGLF